MSAPDARTARILTALKIRILGLEEEYDALAAEMDELAARMDWLLAEAWERHDRLVDMRALAFRLSDQNDQQRREAA
ncbi:hypothetical protein [Hyphomicrobium sp.]|uniref:hypothetical protein n=1 Tax=Hyphomicrobium sp. TaxID=82 RepID=UPI0025BA7B14|nr:hypothetical protein [Hyphomicrobium sp.]MCC7253181.1 hypothetical protein [Hyphomicrobium sp.]